LGVLSVGVSSERFVDSLTFLRCELDSVLFMEIEGMLDNNRIMVTKVKKRIGRLRTLFQVQDYFKNSCRQVS